MQTRKSRCWPGSFLVGWLVALTACSSDDSGDSVEGASGTLRGDPYAFLREGGLLTEDVPAVWARLPYARMSLERTSCFGSCADYTVTFTRGSGEQSSSTASYEGRSYAEREGSYTGTISIWDYGRLCQFLDEFGFMTFDEAYVASWTDDTSTIIDVERMSTSQRVIDYGQQGPPELIALQLAMDAIADRIDWTEAPAP